MTPEQYFNKIKTCSSLKSDRVKIDEEFVRANSEFFIGNRIACDRAYWATAQKGKRLIEIKSVNLVLTSKELTISFTGPCVNLNNKLSGRAHGVKEISFDITGLTIPKALKKDVESYFNHSIELLDNVAKVVPEKVVECPAEKCDSCNNKIKHRGSGDMEILCSIPPNKFYQPISKKEL